MLAWLSDRAWIQGKETPRMTKDNECDELARYEDARARLDEATRRKVEELYERIVETINALDEKYKVLP